MAFSSWESKENNILCDCMRIYTMDEKEEKTKKEMTKSIICDSLKQKSISNYVILVSIVLYKKLHIINIRKFE